MAASSAKCCSVAATLADYFTQQGYLGVTVGRFANRIGRARIERDGRVFQLAANQARTSCTAGRADSVRAAGESSSRAKRTWCSGSNRPDGDQGYPGNLAATVCYRLEDGLRISMGTRDRRCAVPGQLPPTTPTSTSTARRPTCVSMSCRSPRTKYPPTDEDMIPLGKLAPVAGTGFDFNVAKKIGADFLVDAQQKTALGYDHAFQLDPACRGMKAVAASVVSGDGRLAMIC